MSQPPLNVTFPTKKEPTEPIKVRGELVKPGENFLDIASIPGLNEALRLEKLTLNDKTSYGYGFYIPRITQYRSPSN